MKVLGQRFTSITPETPIGAFFKAMYQTGLYWQFLGWTQVIAGVLLLFPATACVGAFLFLGIMTNIFVITDALGFAGTPIVTGLMLLAVTGLVLWDFHCWKRLLFATPPREPAPLPPLRWHRLEKMLPIAGGVNGLLFFLSTRSFIGPLLGQLSLACATLCALAVGALWIAQDWDRSRQGNRSRPA